MHAPSMIIGSLFVAVAAGAADPPAAATTPEPAAAPVVPAATVDAAAALQFTVPKLGVVSLSPHLNTRVRAEVAGPRTLDGSANATLITHRFRAGAELWAADTVGAVVEVQDTRLWGSEAPAPELPQDPTLYGTVAGSVDVHQAYIALKLAPAELRVGRQEIVLTNERLFGNVDFVMRGRVLDAVRVNVTSGPMVLTAFGAVITDADSQVEGQGDRELLAVAADFTLLGAPVLSPIFVYDNNALLERHRFTTGARFDSKWMSDTIVDVDAYVQADSLANQFHLAFLAGARVQQRFDVVLHPKVGGLVDVLSGSAEAGSTLVAFDTLFATNHKFYGFQDLFLNLPLHTRGLGLIDVSPTVSLEEGPFALKGFVHVMMPFAAPATGFDLYGIEPDLVGTWKILQGVAVELGASVFVPMGNSLGRGDVTSPWIYSQVSWVL
jgi:hypothetical protein